MAYDKVEFIITPDQLYFSTQVNGDKIVMTNIVLDADQAAAMAYLINKPDSLKVEIKKEVE